MKLQHYDQKQPNHLKTKYPPEIDNCPAEINDKQSI